MCNSQRNDREESFGSKLLSGLLWGAAIGIGAFIGYQVYEILLLLDNINIGNVKCLDFEKLNARRGRKNSY